MNGGNTSAVAWYDGETEAPSQYFSVITSYDYDAPIGESGAYGQPGIGGPNKFEVGLTAPVVCLKQHIRASLIIPALCTLPQGLPGLQGLHAHCAAWHWCSQHCAPVAHRDCSENQVGLLGSSSAA